ncbi:MFS transporter [Nocardioides panacisoli]|uniref:MFS transporter n=1 Tax=Nocardioides panacisoli TaxID=627624 RepID=A0ABP7IR82_9ACTN
MTTTSSSLPRATDTAATSGEQRLHPVALTAALGALMVPIMSFFSVNVALGEIGVELDASPGMLQLVVGAYGVMYASLVVIGGRLGDSYGRKRMLLVGLTVFAACSLVCAAAQSPLELVGARFLQGVSAALVAPQVLASIHANTEGQERTRALAWFGATAGIATSLAFLVGGSLAGSDLGWRSVFWINAPLSAVVLAAVARWLPESKAPSRTALDWPGAGLLFATMTLLILPLTEGRALGWPTWTWVCLAGVPVAATALVAWQRRTERRGALPLVPPSLFRFRSIRVGLAVATPMFVTFGGFMFIYSYMAGAHGLTPLEIGVSLLPMSAAFLVASIAAGRLVPRLGASVLTVGSLIGAIGFAWLPQTIPGLSTMAAFDPVDVAVPMALAGLGFGLVWSPIMGIVLSQVPGHLAGLGGGLLITVMQAGLGFGSAVVGSIYLGWGVADGFARTAYFLAVAMVAVAALTRLLVARRG